MTAWVTSKRLEFMIKKTDAHEKYGVTKDCCLKSNSKCRLEWKSW